MKPLIVVNFKTYKESSGKNAVKLAKILRDSIISVQAADICETSKVHNQVYSQHVDSVEQGRGTGYLTIEDLKNDGASGSLLNHSEHPVKFREIKKTVERARTNNFKIILCAKNIEVAKKLLEFQPEMLAFEVPELISTGKSITKFRGSSVIKFAKIVKEYNQKHKTKIKALCGAGISAGEDVKSALEMGCDGVLVASAIVKAKNPGKILKEMKNA